MCAHSGGLALSAAGIPFDQGDILETTQYQGTGTAFIDDIPCVQVRAETLMFANDKEGGFQSELLLSSETSGYRGGLSSVFINIL